MGFFFFASRAAARFLEEIRHPAGVSTAALLLTAARCALPTSLRSLKEKSSFLSLLSLYFYVSFLFFS